MEQSADGVVDVGGIPPGMSLPDDLLPTPGPARPNPVAGEAIAARKADGRVSLTVVVPGDGPRGETVEYVGWVSEERLARLPPESRREALLDAVRAERDRRRALDAVRVEEFLGPVGL